MIIDTDTKAETIVTTATALFNERAQFETEIAVRTNEGLYVILQKVYKLYVQAEQGDCLEDTVMKLKQVLAERGVKVQKNTPPATVFVRYVFNYDRKRSYTYTQTLLSAFENNVEASEFYDYVSDNNGVEDIKRTRSESNKQKQMKSDLVSAKSVVVTRLASMEPVQTLKLNGSIVDLNDGANYAFVIARVNSAGDLELLREIPSTSISMQNMAINSLAKQLISSGNNADVSDLQEEKSKALESDGNAQGDEMLSSAFDNTINSATLV